MVDVASAGERVGAAPSRMPPLFAAMIAALAAERDRRALWLPAFFGAGIAVYFMLTMEPPLWLGPSATLCFTAVAVVAHRHTALREAAVALAVGAAGFALIEEHRRERDAPALQRRLGPVAITGRVIDIDSLDRGWRVIIAPDPLPGLDAALQPRRLRIHIPAASDALSPGDRVALKAMLYPVPGPILPDGHDLQREAYFAQIGGVGYSYGGARRGPDAAAGTADGGWREALLRLRTAMTRRITAVLPGSTGGVASALITGKYGTLLSVPFHDPPCLSN